MQIDLNCDMGESYGAWHMGCDQALLEWVTSANIACGYHGGDPSTMRRTVELAVARGVAIGAHPSLPDLQGFGRRVMAVTPGEAYDMVVYQIGALQGFVRAAGGRLAHVKAHGALYNMAARDAGLADAVVRAARDVDPALISYVLAGSELAAAARRLGVPWASEVFADRSYQDDGSLTPRDRPNAMIEDPELAISQVRGMIERGMVRSVGGREVPVRADTLCIHGDQPDALAFARRIRHALADAGVRVCAPAP